MSKPTPRETFQPCSVPGCEKDARRSRAGRRGLCCAHYARWKKYGDPLAGKTPEGAPLAWIYSTALTHLGDECLPWPFAKLGNGYGTVEFEGKTNLAHRVVCTMVHGQPPSEKRDAAHACGNRICVNPHHLSWKTRAGNEADKLLHDTVARGERSGTAKLTEEDVREIRRLGGSSSLSEIGRRYGVNKTAIHKILNGQSWGWLQ